MRVVHECMGRGIGSWYLSSSLSWNRSGWCRTAPRYCWSGTGWGGDKIWSSMWVVVTTMKVVVMAFQSLPHSRSWRWRLASRWHRMERWKARFRVTIRYIKVKIEDLWRIWTRQTVGIKIKILQVGIGKWCVCALLFNAMQIKLNYHRSLIFLNVYLLK